MSDWAVAKIIKVLISYGLGKERFDNITLLGLVDKINKINNAESEKASSYSKADSKKRLRDSDGFLSGEYGQLRYKMDTLGITMLDLLLPCNRVLVPKSVRVLVPGLLQSALVLLNLHYCYHYYYLYQSNPLLSDGPRTRWEALHQGPG